MYMHQETKGESEYRHTHAVSWAHACLQAPHIHARARLLASLARLGRRRHDLFMQRPTVHISMSHTRHEIEFVQQKKT